MMTVSVDDVQFDIGFGTSVLPDNWTRSGKLIESEWEKADWYLMRSWDDVVSRLAVNIKVTGRKVAYDYFGNRRIRCSITFVGDGEPDIKHHGWVYLERDNTC